MVFQIQPHGLQAMLKEGHRHFSGLEEAVLKNIDACQELSAITRTSLGPNGINKMVINHLDKLFVTRDAATIVGELEVQHPAAKILELAGKAQQEEVVDGANLAISFSGELLRNAAELIRSGLHRSEILSGYTKGINNTVEILDELAEKLSETMDVRNRDEVVLRMRAPVASKQYGQEDILCPLIADVCLRSFISACLCQDRCIWRDFSAIESPWASGMYPGLSQEPCKLQCGQCSSCKVDRGGLHDCSIVRGMVLKHDAVGSIKKMEKAKIAVFAGGVDTAATETKGTVLIQNEQFSQTCRE